MSLSHGCWLIDRGSTPWMRRHGLKPTVLSRAAVVGTLRVRQEAMGLMWLQRFNQQTWGYHQPKWGYHARHGGCAPQWGKWWYTMRFQITFLIQIFSDQPMSLRSKIQNWGCRPKLRPALVDFPSINALTRLEMWVLADYWPQKLDKVLWICPLEHLKAAWGGDRMDRALGGFQLPFGGTLW